MVIDPVWNEIFAKLAEQTAQEVVGEGL